MNKTVITIRIDEEIKKKLDMLALKDNRSLNNYITLILIKYLEQQKKSESQ